MRRRAEKYQHDVARLRRDFDQLGLLQPARRDVDVARRVVAGVPVEVLTPHRRKADAVLMYLHGGGHVIGSPVSHRAFTSTLAARLGVEVWVPDYALAPEHPFPAGLDDAQRVWEHLTQRHPARAHWLAGDSAGGGLSLALCHRQRDKQGAMPDRLWLISPWLDVTLTAESCRAHDTKDAVLGHGFTQSVFVDNFCAEAERHEPEASPLFGEQHGLPPVLVQAGEHETLCDDAVRFAEQARAAGVDVRLEIAPRMWHAWVLFAAFVPEARASLGNAIRFFRVSVD